MKKIIIGFILIISVSFSSDTFDVHVDSCTLHIPDRHELKEFSAPYNFHFTYLESPLKDTFTNDNFILLHNIDIFYDNFQKNHKKSYIKRWLKMAKLITTKQYKNLHIWRFKRKEIKMDKKGAYQETAKEFRRQANIFIIFGKNFIIHVDETDPYIDEIYNMIKDCK